MGGDRGRGRGGFDRGRGGRGGFNRPGSMDMPMESDSGYDSEKSQAAYGGGWGGDRGRGGSFGRGGMGGGWGRGGDIDSAPWKQQPDVDVEPLVPRAGRGRGGHAGRSDTQPPWRGQDPEQQKETPSLLGPPPEKKVKQEAGPGLAAIKQEYDEAGPAGSKMPPSLMGANWAATQVKDEPKDSAVCIVLQPLFLLTLRVLKRFCQFVMHFTYRTARLRCLFLVF